jgi:signal transduction histidine kinase
VDAPSFDQALKSDDMIVTNLTGPGPFAVGEAAAVALRQRINLPNGQKMVLSVLVRSEMFERTIRQARIEPSWRPFLIDGADRIISAPRAPGATGQRASQPAIDARATGASGIYPGQAWNGEPVITAFIKSPQTNWSAHISIPAAEYNEPLRRSIAMIAALTLLALLLFAVFAYVARRELVAMRSESEALSRAARMEALGRMTGGVAHDFNNLLMVVATAAEMLRKRNLDNSAGRFLTAIQSAADRGARLTRQLTMFARGQGGEVMTIDVGLRLISIKSLLQQSATDEIPIEFSIQKEPVFIKVDPVQFDLAIVNIVSNARDAMPVGGKIEISLQNVGFPTQTDRGVRLSITDTGSGISPKDLPHVFEPFYTTKEVGKGSGLGLSHVYGFAKAHSGAAEIVSEPGQGTSVSLLFPAVEQPTVAASEGQAPIDISWRGDGLEAIVVDDNDDVRVLTGEVLEDIGFRVRYASNASEAMALCEAGSDLLVSDIVMPGAMNGVGLALLVRQRWPDMQTLLMTGYSEASAEATGAGLRVIRKPFTRAMLLGAINTGRLEKSRRFGGAKV